MKELTIEEKARAYDEALQVLHKYDGANIMFSQSLKEEMFPELKESEDEKIRKNLISYINISKHPMFSERERNEMLAWLEKQRDKDKLIQELGEYKVKYTQEVLEKHINNMNNKDDERLRKTAIVFLKDFADKGYENAVECIDWLEKQGEQKSADKVEPKFKVGEWVIFNGNHNSVYQVERIDNYRYHLRHYLGGSLSVHFDNELIRKWTIQDAKAGDVLVASDGSIFIFKEVVDLWCKHYIAFEEEDGTIKVNDKFAHYWESVYGTCPATKEQRDTLEKAMADSGWAFDFEKKELKKIENETEIPFGAKDSELQEVTYFIPKGFHAEIDDDKVVIKKGEKPAEWSEEDESRIDNLCHFLDEYGDQYYGHLTLQGTISWLKSIKERVQPQNLWKPTEEQMKALNYVVNLMASSKSPKENDYYYNVFKDLRKQIKKLREE